MQQQSIVHSSRPSRLCFKHRTQLALSSLAYILVGLRHSRVSLPLLDTRHKLLLKAVVFQVCKLCSCR